MYEKTATYHKTETGVAAVATRNQSLTPRLRAMLIMVDGKRNCADLARLGDIDQLLPQLIENGLIEPLAGVPAAATQASPARAPTRPSASAPATADGSGVTLAQARQFAVRRLTDMLGPNAEGLCLKIEATRSPQEFVTVVEHTQGVLLKLGETKVAERFKADMQGHWPA